MRFVCVCSLWFVLVNHPPAAASGFLAPSAGTHTSTHTHIKVNHCQAGTMKYGDLMLAGKWVIFFYPLNRSFSLFCHWFSLPAVFSTSVRNKETSRVSLPETHEGLKYASSCLLLSVVICLKIIYCLMKGFILHFVFIRHFYQKQKLYDFLGNWTQDLSLLVPCFTELITHIL